MAITRDLTGEHGAHLGDGRNVGNTQEGVDHYLNVIAWDHYKLAVEGILATVVVKAQFGRAIGEDVVLVGDAADIAFTLGLKAWCDKASARPNVL